MRKAQLTAQNQFTLEPKPGHSENRKQPLLPLNSNRLQIKPPFSVVQESGGWNESESITVSRGGGRGEGTGSQADNIIPERPRDRRS